MLRRKSLPYVMKTNSAMIELGRFPLRPSYGPRREIGANAFD
jgi:hypothetical protein